jgi:hypothetical protein
VELGMSLLSIEGCFVCSIVAERPCQANIDHVKTYVHVMSGRKISVKTDFPDGHHLRSLSLEA